MVSDATGWISAAAAVTNRASSSSLRCSAYRLCRFSHQEAPCPPKVTANLVPVRN